ncbi:MAG: putative porin [Methylophilaceae bacterium]
MKKNQLKKITIAISGSLMMAFGANALADSTFDLVNALVKKGVLTEAEGLELMKGRESDIKAADTKVTKATRLSISDAIDNATLYGDVRARYELRSGDDKAGLSEDRDRGRYKVTLGVKTEAADFYSDLALAMGSGGRSDNATFGGGSNSANGANGKESVFIKRAMVGWHATDWLSFEAGRIANPLYTTSMVWDGDLTFEGLAEKVNFNVANNIDVFGNFVQSQYIGDYKDYSNGVGSRVTNNILAFQGGAKFKITEAVSGKAAITFTKYTNDKPNGVTGAFAPAVGTGATFGSNTIATNNLKTIEIPAEINFKTADDIGLKVFGDYAYNLDGSDRYTAAVAANPAIAGTGKDDMAWLLGVGAEMKQGKKTQKGDWSAKLWYQDVGAYAVDPNAVDSDFMDSRVNMKGIVIKGEYNLRDNVLLNFAAGHATRKNDLISAIGNGSDLSINLNSFDLYQFDVTYKF